MSIERKDFISMKDITKDEIMGILTTAETMRDIIRKYKKRPAYLRDKTVIMLFDNAMSRNKLAYELAGKYLGANIVDMQVGNSKDYGSLKDVGRIIDQMGGDFIVLRSPMSGSAKFLAENVSAGVINAGDGVNENPPQALLDLLTIKDIKGSFEGLKVTIVGNIINSRVARSNIWALSKLGAKVSVASAPTLISDNLSEIGVNVHYDILKAVEDCDVILSLRMDFENDEEKLIPSINEYKKLFGINKRVLSYAKEDVIVMHPGPIRTGIEISGEIIESKHCFFDDQITNGVAVRMALLYLLSVREGVNYEIVD